MLKYVVVTGLVYGGETNEQADAREKAMIEHNLQVDERQAEWDKRRRAPMPSMQRWAKERGIV